MKDLVPFIEKIDALANAFKSDEPEFIESLLSMLLEAGFKSVRYYEVTRDPAIGNRELLVLRSYQYADGTIELDIGYQIPFKATSSYEAAGQDFATGDARHCTADWVTELHLQEDRWVEIEIRNSDNDRSALLALSLPIEAASAGPHAALFYRTIKNIIERFQTNARVKQITDARQAMQAFVRSSPRRDINGKQFGELAAKHLISLVNGAACAIFQYKWADGYLEKVAETFANPVISRAMELEEIFVIGEHLTGAAWENTKLRRVPNFIKLTLEHEHYIHAASVDFHIGLVGPIRSVLYDRFGNGFLQFLVRVINRADQPALPFNYAQEMTLRSACSLLNDYVDDLANQRIIAQFERLSAVSARGITNPKIVAKECCKSLEQLHFEHCVLLYHPSASPFFDVMHCDDVNLLSLLTRDVLELEGSSLLCGICNSNGTRCWRLSEFSADKFADALRSYGVAAVVSAISAANSGGTIALHCVFDHKVPFNSVKTLFDSVAYNQTLPALLSIADSVFEASQSLISATIAEQFIAHVGHEVVSPISSLKEMAIFGCNLALKQIRLEPQYATLTQSLIEHKETLDRTGGQIIHKFRTAVALAEKSAGAISVKFEEFAWWRVIDDAWTEALDWLGTVRGGSSLRGVRMTKNESAAIMRSVGDPSLIQGILTNLLKNAIKYSLPRFPNRPMEVRVLGQPQSNMDIVQVENWGIGIASDQMDNIFNKFVREKRVDRERAIRGLGLGLYVARLYANAHGGELFCRSSVPTLDDPKRIKAMEGYNTTFELRIPKGLSTGVKTAELKQ